MPKEPTTQDEYEELLVEIDKELDKTEFTEADEPSLPHDAKSFRGTSPKGWGFLVVTFDISEQGFPLGSRGASGTVMKDGMIVNLPTHTAERAVGIKHRGKH